MERQQKQESIEEIFPKDLENSQIKNELNEIKKLEEKINRNDLICESSKYKYDIRRFRAIRSFDDSMFPGKITISDPNKMQSSLSDVVLNVNYKVRPRPKADKETKNNAFESANSLYEGRELTLNAFKSRIFPIEATQGEGRSSDLATRLKTLASKQMLLRLPVAFAQVQAGNTSENLRQIIYSCIEQKKLLKIYIYKTI